MMRRIASGGVSGNVLRGSFARHLPLKFGFAQHVRQMSEQRFPQILQVLHIRLPHLPQQQTFQPRHALTIIRTPLRQQPVRLAATTRAAVANGRRPIRFVARPGGRRCGELTRLQYHASSQETFHLVARTTSLQPFRDHLLE